MQVEDISKAAFRLLVVSRSSSTLIGEGEVEATRNLSAHRELRYSHHEEEARSRSSSVKCTKCPKSP